MKPINVTQGVFQVGGPEISAPEDCCVYLVDLGRPLLIDTGSGREPRQLIYNLEKVGYSPQDISLVILTHCHIDHVGGAPFLTERYSLPLAIHELDAPAVEKGDARLCTEMSLFSAMAPLR